MERKVSRLLKVNLGLRQERTGELLRRFVLASGQLYPCTPLKYCTKESNSVSGSNRAALILVLVTCTLSCSLLTISILHTLWKYAVPICTSLPTTFKLSTVMAAEMEPFTLVEESLVSNPHHLFDNVTDLTSGKTADHDLQYVTALRKDNPDMIVTAVPELNAPLRAFAAAGFATCELDRDSDSFACWRGYIPPARRQGRGQLGEAIHFAKYHYKWNNEDFILYTVRQPMGSLLQYIQKERQGSEHALGPSSATDALIKTTGEWLTSDEEVVWVYDRYWTKSKALWQEVEKASWSKVILNEGMKKELTNVTNKFFSSKEVYDDLGVPWKRGLMFYGPPGNGKTISLKALMHELLDRKHPIPTLYVKTAPFTNDIRFVFAKAREQSPCMLILEDIETIVTPSTRSYFFNELDGLANNDGLLVVASTNYLDRLDPGLTQRPSRFDRKYLFSLPNEHERTLYCEFWRKKLQSKPTIVFPEKLCPAMAHITGDFSFAFLQECFVATLLVLARGEIELAEDLCVGDNDLDSFELWVEFKKQADSLRKEFEDQQQQKNKISPSMEWCRSEASASARAASEIGTQPAHQAPGERCFCPHNRGHSILRLSDGDNAGLLPAYNAQKRSYMNSAAIESGL